MKRLAICAAFLIAALNTGCATSQNVTLAQVTGTKTVATAAIVPGEGNSSDMDAAMRNALSAHGVTPKAALPPGTTKSPDVDMIVAYTDQWRWDIVMYLRWVSINMYDADTGNLLATARWDNSAFHGFQDYNTVVNSLVDEMLLKIRSKSK